MLMEYLASSFNLWGGVRGVDERSGLAGTSCPAVWRAGARCFGGLSRWHAAGLNRNREAWWKRWQEQKQEEMEQGQDEQQQQQQQQQ